MIDEFTVTMQPPAVLDVTMAPPAQLNVTFAQQQGVSGPPGIAGPQGVPGPLASSFVFTQAMALSTWTIVHNLGRYPSVTVVDSSDRVVEGDPQYIDSNSLTVSFSAPFSGVAYLN